MNRAALACLAALEGQLAMIPSPAPNGAIELRPVSELDHDEVRAEIRRRLGGHGGMIEHRPVADLDGELRDAVHRPASTEANPCRHERRCGDPFRAGAELRRPRVARDTPRPEAR